MIIFNQVKNNHVAPVRDVWQGNQIKTESIRVVAAAHACMAAAQPWNPREFGGILGATAPPGSSGAFLSCSNVFEQLQRSDATIS